MIMSTRRKHRHGSGAAIPLNGRTSYEQVRAAEWMARLLNDKIFVMDNNFFDYRHWISGDLRPLLLGFVMENALYNLLFNIHFKYFFLNSRTE